MLHDVSRKSGTIHSGMRITAAIGVTSAHKLQCVIDNTLSELRRSIVCCFQCGDRRLVGLGNCCVSVDRKITVCILNLHFHESVTHVFHDLE